jgi:hypothetical protein
MMTDSKPAPGADLDEKAGLDEKADLDEKQAPNAGLRRLIREHAMTVIFEVLAPTVLFYGLRAMSVSQWWSLMAGVLVATPYALWTIARKHRIDLVALVTLSVLVLSVVVGLLSHDPRSLAIREAWTAALGGVFGGWMLVTVAIGRPAQLTLGRTIAEVKRGAEGANAWVAQWDTNAAFRRGLRINTAVWGIVLLAHAAAHIVLACILPIDLISLVSTVVWAVTMTCLVTWHVWYIRKHHLEA